MRSRTGCAECGRHCRDRDGQRLENPVSLCKDCGHRGRFPSAPEICDQCGHDNEPEGPGRPEEDPFDHILRIIRLAGDELTKTADMLESFHGQARTTGGIYKPHVEKLRSALRSDLGLLEEAQRVLEFCAKAYDGMLREWSDGGSDSKRTTPPVQGGGFTGYL